MEREEAAPVVLSPSEKSPFALQPSVGSWMIPHHTHKKSEEEATTMEGKDEAPMPTEKEKEANLVSTMENDSRPDIASTMEGKDEAPTPTEKEKEANMVSTMENDSRPDIASTMEGKDEAPMPTEKEKEANLVSTMENNSRPDIASTMEVKDEAPMPRQRENEANLASTMEKTSQPDMAPTTERKDRAPMPTELSMTSTMASASNVADAQPRSSRREVDDFLLRNGFIDSTQHSDNVASRDCSMPLRKWMYHLSNTQPLHLAVKQNNPEMVGHLLHFGADTTCKDRWGRTPLELGQSLNRRGSHEGVIAKLQPCT